MGRFLFFKKDLFVSCYTDPLMRHVLQKKKCIFVVSCFFFLLPFLSVHAQEQELGFLKPKIYQAKRQLICLDQKQQNCHTLFLIQGKNFLNSNGPGSVRVGEEWATVLRWTDTLVIATASKEAYERQPAVVMKTKIAIPELQTGDATLNALFKTSVQVALHSVGVDEKGRRYLHAGKTYTNPTRTYYRDSYWTAGLLLLIEPSIIRDQILLLARGVEKNGSVPSAITIDPQAAKIPLWTDHYDSGSYFILLVADYLSWTGDTRILEEKIQGRTIYATMESILLNLAGKDKNNNLLPDKPKDSLQDWLDSIPRSGEVLSNAVLYKQALVSMSSIASLEGKEQDASSYGRLADIVRYQINKQFWNEKGGYYYERCYEGMCEDRITNESGLAILFDVVEEKNRERFFEQLSQRLETRYNSEQPYGDWGVMNAFPLYEHASLYHYQNGADWPFLDGINGGARLKYENTEWYYPLTRWWTYWQEETKNTMTLPEYISPKGQYGSLDQAWSVNPAYALIRYGLGFDLDIEGFYETKNPPWGSTILQNIFIRGKRASFTF